MERALCDVFTASADNQKNGNDYSALSPLQLATEVQKLNGYNHFSKSASMLLAEVVTRLVNGHRVKVEDPHNWNGAMTGVPIDRMISIDYHDIITLGFYDAVREGLRERRNTNLDVEALIDEARKTPWKDLLRIVGEDPHRRCLHVTWGSQGASVYVVMRKSREAIPHTHNR